MDDPRKQFFEQFDWKQFENMFGTSFPLPKTPNLNDPAWVNNVVQDVMKQAFPSGTKPAGQQAYYRTEVFETFNNIVVKIHIADKAQARNINPLVGSDRIKLEGLPDNGSQVIPLTSRIVPESSRAVYRKGVLQVQARKAKASGRLHAIEVRYHD
ncbi:MAG: HSP20-like chaperone protein [Paenibacillus sp.]|nr:HSP20-like chaperone protein [Paenibacillus sp.]